MKRLSHVIRLVRKCVATYLNVIEISFASHFLVAKGKVGAPSVIFVNGGRTQHATACRSAARRARRNRVDHRVAIFRTATATGSTAAHAPDATASDAAIVLPRARRRRTQRPDVDKKKENEMMQKRPFLVCSRFVCNPPVGHAIGNFLFDLVVKQNQSSTQSDCKYQVTIERRVVKEK